MGTSSDVPALRRGLAILRLLARHADPMTATAVAGELGIPRSSTYHLLAEMAEAGFVTHLPEERRYGLGVAAFELGSAYLRRDPLAALARPLLRTLVERLGETAHLGVLHGPRTLYLVREQPARPRTLVTDVGVLLPAQLPASGMAMLARLPSAQVRALFPTTASFVDRTGRGPNNLPRLRRARNRTTPRLGGRGRLRHPWLRLGSGRGTRLRRSPSSRHQRDIPPQMPPAAGMWSGLA